MPVSIRTASRRVPDFEDREPLISKGLGPRSGGPSRAQRRG